VRNEEVLLNARLAKRVAWLPILFLITACINAGPPPTHSAENGKAATTLPRGVVSVRDAVSFIAGEPSAAPQQSLIIDARINQPPTETDGSIAPPVNCPVVLARLPMLTDQPFMTEFSVAGVTLPNSIPQSVPSLELVIPFSLGIIDLPAHAQLHGHVFDPAYVSCPDARKLFVLDSISDASAPATPESTVNNGLTPAWGTWSDPLVGLGLNFPDGWNVQATHNVGSIVSAVFTSGDGAKHVALDVTAGETYWTQDSTDSAPAPLQGQRRALSNAGQALARLVDVVGDEADQGHQRTLRLVFNYGGNTVALSTHFVDGVALDPRLLGTFTGMASSFHFDKPLGISDPMDPTLTASSEIGSGPFIGQDTAISIATALSSLTQTTVDDAKMVSEKAARETTPGVCREFQERPQAVWLVKLSGTKPTGESVPRATMLDKLHRSTPVRCR
jgi:hypothetical protein